MSLISCPECSHQVSTHAVNCPSCGYPITPHGNSAYAKKDVSLSKHASKSLGNHSPAKPLLVATEEELPIHLRNRFKNLKQMELSSSQEERALASKHKCLMLQYPHDSRFWGYSKILIVKLLSGLGVFSLFIMLAPFIPKNLLGIGILLGPIAVITYAFRGTNLLRKLGVTSTCPMRAYMKSDLIITSIFIIGIVAIALMGGKF